MHEVLIKIIKNIKIKFFIISFFFDVDLLKMLRLNLTSDILSINLS